MAAPREFARAAVERTCPFESDRARLRGRESEVEFCIHPRVDCAGELTHLERPLVPAGGALVVVELRGMQACAARQLGGALGIE